MPGAVTVIGSLNIDFVTTASRIPEAGETLTASGFTTGLGGKGANQAIACARLTDTSSGVRTLMVGNVGDDAFGRDYKEALGAEKIDHTHVQVRNGQKTGIANIIVEEDSGENRILVATNVNHVDAGKDIDLVPEDASVVVFQLEIPIELVVQNCHYARRKGKYVILNPAPAVKLPNEVYPSIDCIVLNETEAELMCRGQDQTWDQFFFAKGVRSLAILTKGSKGVSFTTKSSPGVRDVPAQKVKVVDTTAAGDTFVGAVAVKIAESGGKLPVNVSDAIEFANRAAAKTVGKSGAVSSIPRLEELK